MKALHEVELQLSRLGIRNRFWVRPEIKELQHILSHDEIITNAAIGKYEGGIALLVATDRRLLLVDKKMWFLSVEDVRFDMITELDYCARLLDATLSVRTINKVLKFTALNRQAVRNLTTYLQERVMELRHMQVQAQEQISSGQPQMQTWYTPPDPQMPQPMVPTPPPQPQHFVSQINPQPRNRLRRIGAYPTGSLNVQRRFSSH